jgi:hypothetical protein
MKRLGGPTELGILQLWDPSTLSCSRLPLR